MYCEKCGTEVQNDDNFCSECGNSLNNISPNSSVTSLNKLKNKKILVSAVCSVLAVVIIVGIIFAISNSSNSNNSIVGSWANSDGNIMFSFYDDGTCDNGGGKYYEAGQNGELRFYDSYHYPSGSTYYYRIEGNVLHLSNSKDFKNVYDFYRK